MLTWTQAASPRLATFGAAKLHQVPVAASQQTNIFQHKPPGIPIYRLKTL
jgi:hypothetical protein